MSARPPMFLYQLTLLLDPEDLVVPADPMGMQYGPDPLDFTDFADWIDLADLVVPLLVTAPTGTEYSYSSSLFL